MFSTYIINNEGFSNVSMGHREDGKPFVALSLTNSPNNKIYFSDFKEKIAGWGPEKIIVTENQTTTTIDVVGKFGINEVYRTLRDDDRYNHYKNQCWLGKLQEHNKTNKKRLNKKFQPTLKSNPRSQYQQTDQTSTNTFHVVHELTQQKPYEEVPRLYYFKVTNDTKVAEIEAYSAALYRLFMGPDHAPKVKTVYDQNKRVGVASRALPGFQPHLAETGFNPDEMIDQGVVPMLVFSYLLEEDDLNPFNWGRGGPHNKIKRIDFDRSFWSRVAKYAGMAPYTPFTTCDPFNGVNSLCTPVNAFPISSFDLLNFPLLRDASPNIWWSGSFRLEKNPRFIEQKWKYFLKAILICDEDALMGIAKAYLGSEKTQQTMNNHLNDRLKKLKEELLQLPEFQQYLAEHPEVFAELRNEYAIYNDSLKGKHDPNKNANMQIDLDKLQVTYNQIILNVESQPAYQQGLSFLKTKRDLADKIQAIGVDSPAGRYATNILNQVKESAGNLEEKPTLINVLTQTKEILSIENPDTPTAKQTINSYSVLANQIKGKPELKWQLLGAAMIGLGAVLCVGGILIAATTLAPSLGVGTAGGIGMAIGGGALALAGMGLFRYGCRKGLSDNMMNLVNEVEKTPRI